MQQEKTLKEIEREWRVAFAAMHPLYQSPQDDNRVIHVTSFDGDRGVAGYVICVDGSPPHGILLAQVRSGNTLCGVTLILSMDGRSKRVRVPEDLPGRSPMLKGERLVAATQELVDWYYETRQ